MALTAPEVDVNINQTVYIIALYGAVVNTFCKVKSCAFTGL